MSDHISTTWTCRSLLRKHRSRLHNIVLSALILVLRLAELFKVWEADVTIYLSLAQAPISRLMLLTLLSVLMYVAGALTSPHSRPV